VKTLNSRYKNGAALKEFIKNNHIPNSNLVFLQVFSGKIDKKFIINLLEEVQQLLPDIQIIGTTTAGEILDTAILEESIILSFTIFTKTEIKIYSSNKTNTHEIIDDLLQQFDNTKKAKVAIAFADGLSINGEMLLNELQNYDKNLIIAGGLAGDNANFEHTFVFSSNEKGLDSKVVIAFLYNDELNVYQNAKFGWKPLGKEMLITKAINNIVYEIDGFKAIDVYEKYLGKSVTRELTEMTLEFPLIVKKGDVYTSRAVVSKLDNGALVFAGNINKGEKVTFGYGNIEYILEDNKAIAQEIINYPIESIFIYSCVARKTLLDQLIVQEIAPFNKLAAVSGFFTYGEFYTDNMHNYSLLNQTMTLLALSESNIVSQKETLYFQKIFSKTKRENTLKALAHFLDTTATELQDERNFIKAILDSQENFVITTDNQEIISANKSFLEFFNVKNVEEFKQKIGNCVYDVFVKDNLNLFSKDINKENWLDYIAKDSSRVYEVILKKETKEHIFTINVERLQYKGNALKSIVFTDVTEVIRTKKRFDTLLKDTKESIEYASMIQESILPLEKQMRKVFDGCFIFNKSKDGAKTQIYNLNKIRKNEYILSVLDSKQEGVKGIFSTMFFNAVEKQIINTLVSENIEDISTKWMLNKFLEEVTTAYFEGIIIYCNLEKNFIRFSGVNTPLYIIQNNQLKSFLSQEDEIEIDIGKRLDFFVATNDYFKTIDTKTFFLPLQEQKEYYKSQLEEEKLNMIIAGFTLDFQETILVKYEGEFTQDKMTKCMDKLEDTIDNMGIFGNIATIFAEQYQNILNYSKSIDEEIVEIIPYGKIQVQRNKQGIYEVNSSNILSLEDKEKIEPKLIEIASLDHAGIRKRYRELRKSGANTHTKGGGIGFYEIAKRCSALEYNFKALNATRFEFNLRSILSNKK